jgi:hypothetical protein
MGLVRSCWRGQGSAIKSWNSPNRINIANATFVEGSFASGKVSQSEVLLLPFPGVNNAALCIRPPSPPLITGVASV